MAKKMTREVSTSVYEIDDYLGYEIVNCEAMRGKEDAVEEAFEFSPIKIKHISGPRIEELVELNESILRGPDTGYRGNFLREYKKALLGKSKEWFLLAVKVCPYVVCFELGNPEDWWTYELYLSLTNNDYYARYGCQSVKFKLWTFDRDGQPKSWHNITIEFIHPGVQQVYVLEKEGVSLRKMNFGIYDKEADVEEKSMLQAAGCVCRRDTFRVYIKETTIG